MKKKTNTTESEQKDTIDTLSENEIGFLIWVLSPCDEVLATPRDKWYQFCTLSERSINSGQGIEVIQHDPHKERISFSQKLSENPIDLMKITTSF